MNGQPAAPGTLQRPKVGGAELGHRRLQSAESGSIVTLRHVMTFWIIIVADSRPPSVSPLLHLYSSSLAARGVDAEGGNDYLIGPV